MFDEKRLSWIILLVLVILAIPLTAPFGFAWDDLYIQDNALRNWEWLNSLLFGGRTKADIFLGNVDEHGPAFQFLLMGLQQAVGIEEGSNGLWLRHYVGFVVCLIGVYYLFKLFRETGYSLMSSIIGVLVIAAHPRILGHSFFNSKDTIFMYLFILAMYLLVMFIKYHKTTHLVLFALLSAFMADMRMIALVLPAMLVSIQVYQAYRQRIDVKVILKQLALMTLVFVLALIFFWPYLWDEPIVIIDKVLALSAAKQPNPTFFNGVFYDANELPWYYLPSFLLITTPLPLVFVLLGSWSYSAYNTIRFGVQLDGKKGELTALSWALIMLVFASIWLSKPVLYNGWRHFQFIWPFLVFTSLPAIEVIVHKVGLSTRIKYLFISVFAAYLIVISSIWYPYGHTFFNGLDAEQENRYEVDYWGLSFHQGFEYFQHFDEPVRVFYSDFPAGLNYELLDQSAKDKIKLVNAIDSADYFITNNCYFFRFDAPVWFGKKQVNRFPFDRDPVFNINRGNTRILSIYKLR